MTATAATLTHRHPARSVHTGQPRSIWPWEEDLSGIAQSIPCSPSGRRCLLFSARTSIPGGRKALDAVFKDMENCLEDFRRLYGAELLHLLPSRQKLATMFAQAPRLRSVQRDGTAFFHKVVELDFRDSDGVYLLFVMGSGSKLDDRLRQPALDRLGAVVQRIQPGAVFAKSARQ